MALHSRRGSATLSGSASRHAPGTVRTEPSSSGDAPAHEALSRQQAWSLYLSHFLSMWNSRTYEYGTILFIQAAFPGTLLPSSINGIAETVCVLVSSAAAGRWIDHSPSRLRPLRMTLVANRVALAACCVLWLFLLATTGSHLRLVLFALVLLLGMAEKAARMANTLAMERDWVPTVADVRGGSYDLTRLNTAMRRIDIGCKVVAPLAVSAVVALLQPAPAALAVGAVATLSLYVELWAATRVWKQSSWLRAPKAAASEQTVEIEAVDARLGGELHSVTPSSSWGTVLQQLGSELRRSLQAYKDGLRYYFTTDVWIPSVGTALLHASVLTWSGTLITWLLNAGFPLLQVTVAKGIGSVFEIGSTVIFPYAVELEYFRQPAKYQASTYRMVAQAPLADEGEDYEDEEGFSVAKQLSTDADNSLLGDVAAHQAVIRVARWALIALAVALVPTLLALFALDSAVPDSGAAPESPLSTATGASLLFVTFLSISFLGRWTYDLAVMQLTQMLVPAAHRSTFGGVEMAVVSCISLVHWVGAAIWHAQADFKWLALGSAFAVAMATVGYVRWSLTWNRHQ